MLTLTRTARLAFAISAAALLAGCAAQTNSTAASQPPTKTAEASPRLTPTPTPTPTVMSLVEAAASYKAGACRVNLLSQTFNQIWQSGSGDIDALRQAAAASRDATSATATELDRGKWPPELQADIALVRDADFTQASILAQIATAPTWDSAVSNSFPAQDDASAASQRIRSRLGLPADPLATC